MPKSQVPVLMTVLRELLRAHGIRQRDIAERLQVCERTVTRWLSSETIEAALIEDLCGLVGVSFFDLCELAGKRVEQRVSHLTTAQEQALAEDDLLTYVFMQLLKGWSADEIRLDLELAEPILIDALIRLQKIGLIELLPRNQVRLRTVQAVQWRPGGPFSRIVNRWLKRCLENADYNEPDSLWRFDEIKLSAASRAQLRLKFETLIEEVQALSDLDRRLNADAREWYALILTARPSELLPYPKWPSSNRGRPARDRTGA